MSSSLSSAVRAFVTVFPAELPDKTMVATIVLVTRYRRPLPVWSGATAAFAIHVTVAVAAGKLLSLLPGTVVSIAVALMFTVGAVLLLRAARQGEEEGAEGVAVVPATAWGAAIGSFGLILLAEWGDLTQLATASLAARSGDPVATGIGALAALSSVAAIACVFGTKLVERFALSKINYVGAAVFAALAAWTIIELIAGL
jgi:putative Ca2+/H+ antiporter (TMEM165/GDT1 family)